MKRTEIVFILDRSGSMADLVDDTIGGYNSVLRDQQEEPGETRVTTVLFDDQYELLHDRVSLPEVQPITRNEYYVRGMTALLDAVGRTVQRMAAVQKQARPSERADKVLFVIITDGHENSSREFRYRHIKSMIERQKKDYGWEFLFLGANIDAIGTAAQLGIAPDRAVNYHADSIGMGLCYAAVSQTVSSVRASQPIAANWKEKLETDFSARRR